MVPGFDEVDRAAPVLLIGFNIIGERWRAEVVEWHEELHAKVVGDEIVKEKEAHITAEVAEEGAEVGLARKRGCEWAVQVHVVPADALES